MQEMTEDMIDVSFFYLGKSLQGPSDKLLFPYKNTPSRASKNCMLICSELMETK